MDRLRLIDFIVWYATKKRGGVSRLRLIKFLYLADWISARDKKHTLTNYEWVFYHYGPYAAAAQHDTNTAVSLGRLNEELIGGFDEPEVHLYRKYGDDPEIWRDVGVGTDARIRSLIDKWIHRPLNEFLDFVYFETEPMQGAHRGDVLNFESTVPAVEPEVPKVNVVVRGSPKTREAVRSFLSRVQERRALDPAPIYDEGFARALSLLNEQDGSPAPIKGEVIIDPDTNQPTRE